MNSGFLHFNVKEILYINLTLSEVLKKNDENKSFVKCINKDNVASTVDERIGQMSQIIFGYFLAG